MHIIGRTADQTLFDIKGNLTPLAEPFDNAGNHGHDFRANPVTRQHQKFLVGGHRGLTSWVEALLRAPGMNRFSVFSG